MLFLDSGLNKTDGVHVMGLARYASHEECMARMAEVQNAIMDDKMIAMQNFAVRTANIEYLHICMPVPKQ